MTRSRAAPPKGGIAWMIVACSAIAVATGVAIELGLVSGDAWGFPGAPAAIAAAAAAAAAIAGHGVRALLGRKTQREKGDGHAGGHP